MTYLITTRNGIKIVVKPTMARPVNLSTDQPTNASYWLDNYTRDKWNSHLSTLPAIILPESLQHLPVGSEVEGREQYEVLVTGDGGDRNGPSLTWLEVTKDIYDDYKPRYPEGYSRIILIADEGNVVSFTTMNRKHERMIGVYNARQENEYHLPPSQEAPKGTANMFSDDEVKAAKDTRDQIINSDDSTLKAIYMAGEIVMWDEIRKTAPQPAEEWASKKKAKELAVDFLWECKSLFREQDGYQTVLKVFDSWFKDSKYHNPPPPDQNKK